ncbi:hypothetical protein ABPG74_000865 [Tetrahymena malaccensis]
MCSHKNIVKYYDSFQIEDNFYIVMEKVECSLKQWIDDNRKNQIEKVQFLRFALQMVEVADYLHQKKHILSNISLKNIFLDKDLNIKFSTFTVKQEVSVYKLLNKQIYALENNELIYFPLCLIDEGGNENLIIQSSKQDMYAIGLCLYCLTGVSYMDVLNYIQGGKFQININLGIDINQLLQLMLLRNSYSFVPTCCYFIQSLQNIIKKGNATLQIDKDEEIQLLKLFQEVVNKIDYIKEKQDELLGVKEKSEEIENDYSSISLEKLRQLIQKYQNCDIYYFFEGCFHYRNQNDELSLHSLKIALELNEKNDIALYQQGLIFNELGLTQESLECYYQFCRLNPLDDEVYSNIGEIFLNEQDYKRSKKYFEASLAINPRQYVAYLNIGQVYFQQKMFEKAAYYFKKTNKIKSDADAFYLLGYYYEQKKDYEKSLNSYKKSQLSNQSDLPYINLINNIKSLI